MIWGRSRRAMIWKQDVSPWASFSRCWSLDVLVWTASTRLKRVWYATTFVLFESEDILSEALSLKCGWFTAYSSHWGWFQTGLPPSCNLFIAADASQQRSPLSSGGQHLNEITFGLLLSVWNVEKQQVLGKMNELRLYSTSAVGMFDHEDFMVCQRLLFILFANISPLKHGWGTVCIKLLSLHYFYTFAINWIKSQLPVGTLNPDRAAWLWPGSALSAGWHPDITQQRLSVTSDESLAAGKPLAFRVF